MTLRRPTSLAHDVGRRVGGDDLLSAEQKSPVRGCSSPASLRIRPDTRCHHRRRSESRWCSDSRNMHRRRRTTGTGTRCSRRPRRTTRSCPARRPRRVHTRCRSRRSAAGWSACRRRHCRTCRVRRTLWCTYRSRRTACRSGTRPAACRTPVGCCSGRCRSRSLPSRAPGDMRTRSLRSTAGHCTSSRTPRTGRRCASCPRSRCRSSAGHRRRHTCCSSTSRRSDTPPRRRRTPGYPDRSSQPGRCRRDSTARRGRRTADTRRCRRRGPGRILGPGNTARRGRRTSRTRR